MSKPSIFCMIQKLFSVTCYNASNAISSSSIIQCFFILENLSYTISLILIRHKRWWNDGSNIGFCLFSFSILYYDSVYLYRFIYIRMKQILYLLLVNPGVYDKKTNSIFFYIMIVSIFVSFFLSLWQVYSEKRVLEK